MNGTGLPAPGDLETDPAGARAVAAAYRGCMNIIALVTNLLLVSIVLVVIGAVFVRYFGVLRGSLDWATEYGRFAIVWVVMLGSTVALAKGAHVGIDFGPVLPSWLHRPVRTAAGVLGFVFVAVLAWQGGSLCLATTRQISPAMGVSMSLAYLAIPVGAGIMALQSVLFACWPAAMQQWSPPSAGEPSASD